MEKLAFKTSFSSAALEQLKSGLNKSIEKPGAIDETKKSAPATSFLDYVKSGVEEVNNSHKIADKMATDVASGKSQNLHESMLALTNAELSFNFMVQVRNKALEAYQEIMRMPV